MEQLGNAELKTAAVLVMASTACSASIIEFTVPQVVKLSSSTPKPLPPMTLYPHRALLFGRMLGPQTAITCVQFSLVRQFRRTFDSVFGPSPLNLSFAYGAASVPFIAAKYNLIIADVYKYNGRASPVVGVHGETAAQTASRFWRTRIQPGLLWSFLRDSGAVGGGIVLGPHVSAKLVALTDGTAPPSTAQRFVGGVLSGSICGLATQLFHNAALTAGRMAEAGGTPGNVECMRRVLSDLGPRAVYLNIHYRVAIIAFWSGVLTVARPFE